MPNSISFPMTVRSTDSQALLLQKVFGPAIKQPTTQKVDLFPIEALIQASFNPRVKVVSSSDTKPAQ